MNKIKRVKIINKFVKITQSGGELGKLNNSFFKLLFLVVFLNLLSFASFGEPYTENGVMYSFDTGTLTISKIGGDDKTKGEITQEVVQRAMSSYGKNIKDINKVKIEAGITIIGEKAFYKCSKLTSITIPSSVMRIGNGAFCNCSSLEKITVDGKNSTYKDIYGVLFTKDGAQLICYPAGKTDASYTIPEGVTSIGNDAFNYCTSLKSVIIPNTVTSIGNDAFYNCTSLKSVIIPNTVTSIGNDAFYRCTSLTSVIIPNTVTSIGNDAFNYCTSLTSVTIPNSVTSIGYSAFFWCRSLKSVIIPNSVTSIGGYAFYNCTSLKSVIIPNSVTSIDGYAFDGCGSLKDVYYLGTEVYWESLKKKISSSYGNDPLTSAEIHCNCKPKTLTVNKIWEDNGNSGDLRGDPTFVLYKVYTGCTKRGERYTRGRRTFIVNSKNGNYAKEENGRYTVYEKMAENTEYTQDRFSNNVGGNTNTWQYKITVFNHEADSTYAVGEKRMKGYTSDAYVD